jgi:hypothetical protein
MRNIVRRAAIADLFLLFGIETHGLPRGYRPGDADDAISRDCAMGIVSRYTSLRSLRGQVPLWLQVLGYPGYGR